MSYQHDSLEHAAELRRQAEELLTNQVAGGSEGSENKSPEEMKRMLHELRVHQIELEMQNEELRRVQEELDASRARYFDLYDLAPAGYCTVNEKGFILKANLTAAKMLGVTRNALVNNLLSSFIVPEDQDLYYLHRKKIIASEKPQVLELRLRHGTGTLLWAELSATIVHAANAEPVCQVILIDITERKCAEVENRKLQVQLQEAHKMEAVGRLAGGVAHDFNNMLGVILGNIELVLSQMEEGQRFKEDLQEVKTAANRSADLTRQLLAFARKQTISRKIIDVHQTLNDMIKMLNRLIAENIVLDWVCDDVLWPIKMDPSQLDHILVNLCINARDAITDVGRITISTSNVTLDEACCVECPDYVPGDYVRIAVSDNGIGMDEETQAHIFEPFFTSKEINKGTGMGLATVYGVVKQNSGMIKVHSELGRGTTFTIHLPRYVYKEIAEESAQDNDETRSKASSCTKTLLIVEDELALLKLSRRILERQSYTVLTAGTPGEALQVAHSHDGEINLLLTDVVMPEMNGRELSLKIMTQYPDIKTLFMSGYTAAVMAQHGLTENGVNFIQKPFAIKELTEKVKEVLNS